MSGFAIAPNPAPNPAGFAQSAEGAYSAGLQFATALRTAAAQQQQHNQQSLKDQFETELKLRKDGYSPLMQTTGQDPSGLKRRDTNPAADQNNVITDHFGRKWVAPPPKPDATPQQSYTDLSTALREGAQPVQGGTVMAPGGAQQEQDAQASLPSAHVPVPDPSRVVTPPGSGRSLYIPTGEEKAATTLQEQLRAQAAKGENLDTFHTTDADGNVSLFAVNKKTGKGEQTGTFPGAAKGAAEKNYRYDRSTDEQGNLHLTRVTDSGIPEAWNGAAKKWETLGPNNHLGAKPQSQNIVIPGLANQTPEQTKLTGDEYLKSLPTGTAAQVKAISEGRMGMPSGSSRSPGAQQMRNAVLQFDPGFSEQRAQVRKAFTTGPDGKNIGALNTAVVHLGRLGDTAEALQNGTFTPGNELFNYVKDKFGSAATTNFGLLRDAVAGEMASALKGTATDIEIEKMGKSIRGANSPEQMRGVINEGMGILNDKANTYDERYHAVMRDDPWSPILPSAKAQLQKHGVKATGAGGGGRGNPNPNGYVVNHKYGGMTYLGGDPKAAASWKK